VLQCTVVQENRARDNRNHNQFWDGGRDKERSSVGMVEENVSSDDDAKVCVAEWVDVPKGKPMACAFLKPDGDKKDEVRFTFDISKL
jgi:hypothetical protein